MKIVKQMKLVFLILILIAQAMVSPSEALAEQLPSSGSKEDFTKMVTHSREDFDHGMNPSSRESIISYGQTALAGLVFLGKYLVRDPYELPQRIYEFTGRCLETSVSIKIMLTSLGIFLVTEAALFATFIYDLSAIKEATTKKINAQDALIDHKEFLKDSETLEIIILEGLLCMFHWP